jgi:hypothetical protein
VEAWELLPAVGSALPRAAGVLLPEVEAQVQPEAVWALLPEAEVVLMRLQAGQPAEEAVLREEVFLLPVGAVARRHRLPRRRIYRKSALPA